MYGSSSTLSDTLLGSDVKIRRQIKYWAATVAVYSLCIALLWLVVRTNAAPTQPALWLSVGGYAGMLLSYGLIRASARLNLAPSQLAAYQGNCAIVYIVAAYAITGPARGATLIILMVVLVFCAFALEPEKVRTMSRFSIVLLGATMLWLIKVDPVRFPIWQEALHFLLAAVMMAVAAYLIAQLSELRIKLKTQKAELAAALARIETLATRDDLTAVANRRYMNEILESEERRRATQGQPACIALIDIDWFKRINDTYGHAAGDDVLRAFAQHSQDVLRATDVLARWGGEEFLLLLPNTELQAATLVLERIRERIATLRFPAVAPGLRVSFSCGLIALRESESMTDGISRADRAMYDAKSSGRDRVVVG